MIFFSDQRCSTVVVKARVKLTCIWRGNTKIIDHSELLSVALPLSPHYSDQTTKQNVKGAGRYI